MPNVTLTLPDDVLANAKEVARRECRSLSQQVAYLIQQDSDSRPAPTKRVSAATDSAGRRSTPRKRRGVAA